jgi:hypothetical protein
MGDAAADAADDDFIMKSLVDAAHLEVFLSVMTGEVLELGRLLIKFVLRNPGGCDVNGLSATSDNLDMLEDDSIFVMCSCNGDFSTKDECRASNKR